MFAVGSDATRKYAPIAAAAGCIVIDNSSLYRYDPRVPLIVPECNPDAIMGYSNKNIIANPNCSTAQMVVALKPLHDRAKIKRVVVSTYQSVSGTGKEAIDELWNQTKGKYVPGREDEDEVREILRESPGILVIDKREDGGYMTPIECVGEYATYISRIRQDSTIDNGINLWCVSDNLRKGAALNAVQIAELLGRRVLKKG